MNKKSIIRQLFFIAILMLFASCAATRHNVLMGDVITFSEQASTNFLTGSRNQGNPYMLHTDLIEYDVKEALKLKQQIKNAPYGKNTSLVYALDLGLNRIKYIRKNQLKNDKLAKYYIFLLTDGLDNTSVEVARNNKQGNYKNLKEYQKKVQKKAKKLMGNGKEQNLFQIWPMLQIGSDLEEFHQEQMPEMSNEEFANFCKQHYMEPYMGASKGYEAPDPIVAYSFAEVQNQIIELFSSSAFEFYVPKGYDKKLIKMNLVDENGQKASFEGRVVKKGKKFYMRDIELKDGLKVNLTNKQKKVELVSTNNSDKNAIVAWFRFENLELGGKKYKVDPSQVKQSYFNEDIGLYQPNSEYDRSARPQIDTYFQFIMDTSGSVGDNVEDEQKVLMALMDIITRDLKKAK